MIDIIFKDESLLAVNKPPGLLSVPGRALDNQDCLINQLHSKFPEALLIHRLDMDTSGVMIFARSSFTQKNLAKAFEQRKIKKNMSHGLMVLLKMTKGKLICRFEKIPSSHCHQNMLLILNMGSVQLRSGMSVREMIW